jgi:hypothetical protein
MTTQNEITRGNHHRAVRFFWGLLIGATMVSLAGNVVQLQDCAADRGGCRGAPAAAARGGRLRGHTTATRGPGPSLNRTASVSHECHNYPKPQWSKADLHARVFRRHGNWWTPVDASEHPESTSQAEYAGSIPVISSTVIGSPITRANAAERRFCQRAGTYPIPTVSIRDHGLRWPPPAKLQSAGSRDVTILT